MTAWRYIGVDWSSGSWVAVGYGDDESPNVRVYDHIEEVWDAHEATAERIIVDVPIGLCDPRNSEDGGCKETDGEYTRHCDDLARTYIGPRYSSVFNPPCRKAAEMVVSGKSYAKVNDTNKEMTGKGLMRQAANISDGIVEVERLLLEGDVDKETLVEGHPEVSFRAFNGEPLQFSKKYVAGLEERLSALDSAAEYDAGDWRSLADELREEDRKVELDDLLDALALALTACGPEENLHTLPACPPTDPEGLPIQMVYRAESARKYHNSRT